MLRRSCLHGACHLDCAYLGLCFRFSALVLGEDTQDRTRQKPGASIQPQGKHPFSDMLGPRSGPRGPHPGAGTQVQARHSLASYAPHMQPEGNLTQHLQCTWVLTVASRGQWDLPLWCGVGAQNVLGSGDFRFGISDWDAQAMSSGVQLSRADGLPSRSSSLACGFHKQLLLQWERVLQRSPSRQGQGTRGPITVPWKPLPARLCYLSLSRAPSQVTKEPHRHPA